MSKITQIIKRDILRVPKNMKRKGLEAAEKK